MLASGIAFPLVEFHGLRQE